MRLSAALFLCAYLLIDSNQAMLRAREAMSLWASSVAPALFPFLALLPALTDEAALSAYERLFGRGVKKLFRISGASAAPCLIGLIAGSPAGAIATLRAYRAGAISKRDARVLSALSSGVGPVFIVSSVGGGMMNDTEAGVRLLICAWASSFISAFLISRIRLSGADEFYEGGFEAPSTGAVREAVVGILTVCGYMTVFRVFAGGLPGEIYAFFEISGGCSVAAGKGSLPMASAVIGFGGVCLLAQNYAHLKSAGMGFFELFLIKAAGGMLCAGLSAVWPEGVKWEIKAAPDAYVLSCALGVLMALVCAFTALYTHFRKKQRIKNQ